MFESEETGSLGCCQVKASFMVVCQMAETLNVTIIGRDRCLVVCRYRENLRPERKEPKKFWHSNLKSSKTDAAQAVFKVNFFNCNEVRMIYYASLIRQEASLNPK